MQLKEVCLTMGCVVTSRVEFDLTYVMKMNGIYNLQSHRCRFEASVSSHDSSKSLIITFKDLKDLMASIFPDNSVVFASCDIERDMNITRLVSVLNGFSNPLVVIPTNESLCVEELLKYLSNELSALLDSQYPDVYVIETRLRENNESYVTLSCK